MMRLAVPALILLTACTYIDVRPVGTVTYPESSQQTASFLLGQVDKCWVRDRSGGFGPDAILRTVESTSKAITITVGRDNTDIPFQPFFVMIIRDYGGTKSSIDMQEGSYAYNTYMDFEQDVRRWVQGDLSCSELKASRPPRSTPDSPVHSFGLTTRSSGPINRFAIDVAA